MVTVRASVAMAINALAYYIGIMTTVSGYWGGSVILTVTTNVALLYMVKRYAMKFTGVYEGVGLG